MKKTKLLLLVCLFSMQLFSQDIVNMQDGDITTCDAMFYDSGGIEGNYQNNENFVFTFYPGEEGNMVSMLFEDFSVEAHNTCGWDGLQIFDGTDPSAPSLGTFCGTNSPGRIIASNPDGAITFRFYSDGVITAPGWTAIVECIDTDEDFMEIFLPQTGSSAIAGNDMEISWYSLNYASIDLYYSTNDGADWQLIVDDFSIENGPGNYIWEVPSDIDEVSEVSLIKLIAFNSEGSQELISGYFKLVPSVLSIIAPSSGEEWNLSENEDIKLMIHLDADVNGNIQLYRNSTNLLTVAYFSAEDVGELEINYQVPPNLMPDSSYYLRVHYTSNLDDNTYYLNSDTFSIVTPTSPYVGYISPSQRPLLAGSTYTINWSSYHVESVALYYSVDNGEEWNMITEEVNTLNGPYNHYIWTIPADITEEKPESFIKIVALGDEVEVESMSEAFIIVPQFVEFIVPDASTEWEIGSVEQLQLVISEDYQMYLYPYLYRENSHVASLGFFNNPGVGDLDIDIEIAGNFVPDSNYRFRLDISFRYDGTWYYQNYTYSDYFTIQTPQDPFLEIVTPNSGYYSPGELIDIQWISYLVDDFALYFSLDNGDSWELIADTLESTESPTNYYYWVVPEIAEGTYEQSLIKVVSLDDGPELEAWGDTMVISTINLLEITNPAEASLVYMGQMENIDLYLNYDLSLYGYIYLYRNNPSVNHYVGYFNHNGSGEIELTYEYPELFSPGSNYQLRIQYTYNISNRNHNKTIYSDNFYLLSPNNVNLIYLAGENGQLQGETFQILNFGQDGSSVTAIPNEGCYFMQWSDGSTENPRTETSPESDIMVTAEFGSITYVVEFSCNATRGTIVGEPYQIVNYGSSTSIIEAVPNEGFKFNVWLQDGEIFSNENPLIIANVTSDISLIAFFGTALSVDQVEVTQVKVYPNPTDGIIYINGESVTRFEILNVLGEIISSGEKHKTVEEINLSNQPAGIYLLRAYFDNKTETIRIIKK